METSSQREDRHRGRAGCERRGLEAAVRRVYTALARGESAPATDEDALDAVRAEGAERVAVLAERAADALGAAGDVAYADEILPCGLHRTLYMSPTAERYLGAPIPHGADARAAWRAAIHVEDRLAEAALVARLARGAPAETRYRIVARDGTVRQVRDRGWPRREHDGSVLVLGVVNELPGAADSEEVAGERLASIAESIDEALWEGEVGEDGSIHVLYASSAFERLLGSPVATTPAGRRELVSIWREAVEPHDRPVFDACLQQLARGEPCDAQYRLCGLDGRQREVWARARARRGLDGRIRVAGVIIEVTARQGTHAARPRSPSSRGRLTPRQLEILRLLAAGVATNEVAERLGLTVTTVRNHANRILRSLGAHSRLEAVARARERGLL